MKDETFKKYCLVIDEWFVNGFNGTKAYLKFYPDSSYESADASFRDILEIPRMKEYKETKVLNTSNELHITLVSQLKRLDNIIDTAEKESDKINAIREQNKLLALYREHNEQRQNQTTNVINLGQGSNPNETST